MEAKRLTVIGKVSSRKAQNTHLPKKMYSFVSISWAARTFGDNSVFFSETTDIPRKMFAQILLLGSSVECR